MRTGWDNRSDNGEQMSAEMGGGKSLGRKDKEEERKDESKGLYQRERKGGMGAEEQKNQTTDERRQKIREIIQSRRRME